MAKVLRDYVRDAAHFFTAPGGETKQAPAIETKASAASQAAFAVQAGIAQYPPREYRALYTLYRSNPIVRRATKLCAEAVAAIEPVVKVNGEEDLKVAEMVAQWMRQPNPGEAGFAFRAALASFFKLSGNGWVEGVRGMTGYFEAYALRHERMRVIPGADGWPSQYEYDPGNGRKVRWGANFENDGRSRLLHIKDFSTDNDYFGAGALEAAEGPLALYENAQTLARALFENGLLTSGLLTYDPQVPAGQTAPPLSEEQRTMLQKLADQFKVKGKRAGGVMIASASLKYTPLATTMVDLQAEEIRNQAKRDIALAFGVPPMMLGIPGDNTYSNYQEAGRAFYRNTVIPDAQRLFAALAPWIGAMLGIPGLTFEIDEDDLWALSEELNMRAARIEASQVLSYQEKREALGYDAEPPAGQMPTFAVDMMQMLAQDLARPEPKRIGSSRDES